VEPSERLERIGKVSDGLSRRARRLRAIAVGTIFVIVALLVTGLLFFYFAGRITSTESIDIQHRIELARERQGEITVELVPELIQVALNANRMNTEIAKRRLSKANEADLKAMKAEDRYAKYQLSNARPTAFASRAAILKYIKDTFAGAPSTGNVTVALMFSVDGLNRVSENNTAYVWEFDRADLPEIQAAISKADIIDLKDAADGSASNLSELLFQREANEALLATLIGEDKPASDTTPGSTTAGKAREAESRSGASRDIGYYYLQLNLNKFGSIALISALITVLLSFYKYNLRLAAFYQARADALDLQPTQDKVGFVRLASAFTPNVDFSKEERLSSLLQLLEHLEAAKKET
jgi:hypothetical protein